MYLCTYTLRWPCLGTRVSRYRLALRRTCLENHVIGFASLTRNGRASFSDEPVRAHQCDSGSTASVMHGHPGLRFSRNLWEAMTFRAGIYKAPLPCPFLIRGAFSFDIPIDSSPLSIRSRPRADASAFRFKYDKDISDSISPAGRRGRGQSPSKSRRRRRVCVWARSV